MLKETKILLVAHPIYKKSSSNNKYCILRLVWFKCDVHTYIDHFND